jgi:DNA gyrase/topoisomerase IV subunit A
VLKLAASDELCHAATCDDGDAVVVACSAGKLVAFPADSVPQQTRTAAGVIAKKLVKGASVLRPCALGRLAKRSLSA